MTDLSNGFAGTQAETNVIFNIYADGMQVAQIVNGVVFYVMPDGLGSVTLVLSSFGIDTFKTDYAPYGQSYDATGTETSMYRGQPYDSATGLYYFGARFYDPAIGRFITQDSFSGTLSDPLSLDRYAYARDNPMTLSDPSGHDWWNNWNDLIGLLSNGTHAVASALSGTSAVTASTVSATFTALASATSTVVNSFERATKAIPSVSNAVQTALGSMNVGVVGQDGGIPKGRLGFYGDFFQGVFWTGVGYTSIQEAVAIAFGTGLLPEASPFAVPAIVGLVISGAAEIGVGMYYFGQAYQDAVRCGGWNCVNPFE